MNKYLKTEFDRLNRLHWSGKLPGLNVVGSTTLMNRDGLLGEYYCPTHPDEDHPDEYVIVVDITQPRSVQRSTLLHEMCHHAVFLANKTAYYQCRLHWHGRKWKAEMKRVGFLGKIDQYS